MPVNTTLFNANFQESTQTIKAKGSFEYNEISLYFEKFETFYNLIRLIFIIEQCNDNFCNR